MSKIVISGYYGFNNAGDEAMLTAIIENLREASPVEIVVISGSPLETAKKHNVESIHRFNALKIMKAFMGADMVLSGGGSLLQDVTSKKSLMYYLTILLFAKLFARKVMLFAQGIGPIRNGFLRMLTKIVCNLADVITVRDDDSYEELARLGVTSSKVTKTADAVLALHPVKRFEGMHILENEDISMDKPIIGVSVRPWKNNEQGLKELARALKELNEKIEAQIVLLPLQHGLDTEVCNWMQKYLAGNNTKSVVLRGRYTTEEFLSIIGNFQLLIGMRLHAVIFAAIMKIPFLAISYDPKIEGFAKMIEGTVIGNIEEIATTDIVQETMTVLDKDLTLQNEKIDKLQSLSKVNFEQAFKLVATK